MAININRTDPSSYFNVNSTLISYNDNQSHLHLTSTNGQVENSSEHLKLVERLTTHITLIVSIIGLIGNACTIVVLNRQSMRKWRSSILLSALAAVDFLYLLIIFLSILDAMTNQSIGLHRSLILCQATVYITHVCSFLSANFTLSFTLQRFVAVLFPLHANTVISNRSSIINISILLFIGCSFYSFSFFVTNISKGQCLEDESYPVLFPLLIVDTCFTFVLPFIFIFIFNCAIVYKLRTRKRFTESSVTTHSGSSRTRQRPPPSRIPVNDLYHEQQHLSESNPNETEPSTGTTYIPLKNGNNTSNGLTPTNRKNSEHYNELTPSTTKGNGYFSRFTRPRGSTVTMTNDFQGLSTSNSNHSRQGISQRTTKMLVICSTTFLLFNSPYCAVLLYSIISKVVLTRTLGILRHFYFMSFCLNFFLYSLCGNRFRHELILLFKTCSQKCCKKNIRSHWLRIEKLPKQTSFTRVATRTNV